MTRKILSPKGLLVFVTLCCVFGIYSSKNIVLGEIDGAPEAAYTWTAPDYGTAVHHYVVEILVNDLDTTTINPVLSEFISVAVVYGNKYRVRVAAVDAAGVQGGFSPWSLAYTPELTPPEF